MSSTNLKKPNLSYKIGLKSRPFSMACDYRGDGIGTKNKSLKFLSDKKFVKAWEDMSDNVYKMTGVKTPDVRWRAHMAVWAAKSGLSREGDFVECGVHSAMYSTVICKYLDFEKVKKKFWLFDTWSGVPTDSISETEEKLANNYNKTYHKKDIFEEVKNTFSDYKNCKLIRGELPGTIAEAKIEKIAYLSMDLNNATFEKSCIDILWPRLTSGAIVLLDDYNFKVCRIQQDMWDDFASKQGTMVASLPTGQGIIIKP